MRGLRTVADRLNVSIFAIPTVASLLIAGVILVWQAFTNSPTSDEAAHLVSGVAMVQTGDPGFYRVNPPLHKLVSGIAVELSQSPGIPGLVPASLFGSGSRGEFRLAEEFLETHSHEYGKYFFVGRLVRIPLILLAGWCLATVVPRSLRWPSVIAASLWLTSPLVLGHGWAIMPDALSGCACILLLTTTIAWLEARTHETFMLVGIAWGIAISTKFTFCPLFLVWPIGLLLYQWTSRLSPASDDRERSEDSPRWISRLLFCHIGHGLIAWLVVVGLYGASEVGVTFDNHAFQSVRLALLTDKIGSIPSPFPKQFLIGIDEQQLDLERGYPSYFLGTWYPEGMTWYYVAGILAKEQVVFSIGLVVSLLGGWKLLRHPSSPIESNPFDPNRLRQRRACFAFCLFVAVAVVGILSMHSRMALNVRYAFPAMPALYLVIGIGSSVLLESYTRVVRPVVFSFLAIMAFELISTFPHFYSYASPMLGGSYRVPSVLHDSNFDGGQDLWRLEHWLIQNPTSSGCERYLCVQTNVPKIALRLTPNPPNLQTLDRLIAKCRGEPIKGPTTELIVMRGLGAPAPWTRLIGEHDMMARTRLTELLRYPPDEFLTPTIGIYRSDAK